MSNTVTITPVSPTNPTLKVTPDSVEVGRHDEVEWICSTVCEFDVTFTDSMKPFKDRSFNKNKPKSGHPTGAPGKYKYTVIVGGDIIDPDVIVKGGG
jgi:plastocyanin